MRTAVRFFETNGKVAHETDRSPFVTLGGVSLPVLQDEPFERADAARNRGKVLAAAERLFSAHGPGCVSMEAVAAEAGVGKGTLFRRFGDRAGLIQAVLDEPARQLQEELIRGPAPLGPGAPPVQRLVAFGERLLEHHERLGELLLAAEASGGGFRAGPFAFYRTHVGLLVHEADPETDADYVADVLMVALSAEFVGYQRRVRDLPHAEILAGWTALVERLVGPA